MYKILFIITILFITSLFSQENRNIKIIYQQDNDTKIANTELDTDQDCIIDKYDKCPNTPLNVCVDKHGCTKSIKKVINFDSSSYEIKKEFNKVIQNTTKILSQCSGYKININAHTDSTASERFNITLSQQRANSIKDAILNYNIKENRINIKWHGEAKPIDTNSTKSGRYKNRRVEMEIN